MSRLAQFGLLARYNHWMNVKVFDTAARLPAAKLALDRGAYFGSIIGTLNHLVVGDTLWMQRFAKQPGAGAALAGVAQLPRPQRLDDIVFATLDELLPRRAFLDQALIDWVAAMSEGDLDHELRYLNTRGEPNARPLGILLMHVFNHQTHHRGQVTTLLSQAGEDVGVTDLLALVPSASASVA